MDDVAAASKQNGFCNNNQVCIFQDVVRHVLSRDDGGEGDNEQIGLLSEAFFELANAKWVGYRLPTAQPSFPSPTAIPSSNLVVRVNQDTSVTSEDDDDIGSNGGKHSGKIVWEASFVLMQFLLERRPQLGRTLEIGSGCGLLGLVMAASQLASHVVVSDTRSHFSTLQANISYNRRIRPIRDNCQPAVLDWENCESNVESQPDVLSPHSMDAILGTDVVFTSTLVEPLLLTIQLMAHSKTIIYLCLPIRCIVAYRLLFSQASRFDLEVSDISQELSSSPTCAWGLLMECRLLKLSVVDTSAA